MNIDRIHPELREVVGRIPSIPFHNRLFLTALNLLSKFIPKAKSSDGLIIEEKKLGNSSVRIYRPEKDLSGAGLLWIHGGGLITGSAAMNDKECSLYAKELKLVVVSVEYRLAPAHPFPSAIDDCFEAWQWLQNAATDLGIDPARIVVSGQSAGGGLAASLVQRVFDEGGVQPAGQALFCPMLDDRTAARRELDILKHRIWNNQNNRGAWSWYLSDVPGKPDAPQYAMPARRKNLSGLHAAWIGVGNIDLFCEEDRQYAARLVEAGVSCQLDVVPMAPHAFETFVPDASISRDFYAANYRFLRKALGL